VIIVLHFFVVRLQLGLLAINQCFDESLRKCFHDGGHIETIKHIFESVSHLIAGSVYQQATDWTVINQGSIPGRERNFSPLHCVHSDSEAHSVFCLMGTGGSIPGSTVT
jgi:hypothetical protein